MKFCDINPYIRFAEYIYYQSEGNLVMIQDCRLFYAISGEADIYIEEQHYELVPGSLFYCCSGKQYNIVSNGVRMICLNFDLNQENNRHTAIYSRLNVNDIQRVPSITLYNIEDSEFINSYSFLPQAKSFLESLENILDEFSTKIVGYQENCSGMLKSILVGLHRHSLEGSTNATDAVSNIISYIKGHYHENITNDLLSEMSGYHEYHLNRLFMKHAGITVHKYILAVRIDEAKKMLLNTDLSLTMISEKVGFNSNTHFSNYFKQFVGISPLSFRKQYKNKL